MKTFEYKWTRVDFPWEQTFDDAASKIEVHLNLLGAAGWEVIKLDPIYNELTASLTMCLKRECIV